MAEDKTKRTRGALAVGSALTLVVNGALLSVDLACGGLDPDCYQFEAVGFVSTASDTGLVQQPSVGINSIKS